MEILAQLTEAAREIVRRGRPLARDVEVYAVRRDAWGYQVQGRTLAPRISLGRVRVGLRVLTDRGVALAATTSLDPDENLAALRAALRGPRPTPLGGFAQGGRLAPDLSAHDPAWDAWLQDPARLRDLAAGLRDAAWAAGPLQSLEGELGLATTWTVLATAGAEAAFKRTAGTASALVDGVHTCVRHLDRAPDAALEAEVRALGAQAYAEIPARRVTPADLGFRPGDVVPAVLHPRLTEAIVRTAGPMPFLGGARASGGARFEPGTRIWDPALTLVDSGVEPGLVTTRPVDDEGLPTRRTVLVEGGAFAGAVWSRRSAAEAGRDPTGNGYRSPMLVEEPHEAPVRDKLSGLLMAPGEGSLAELLAGVERGVYLFELLGLHGADKARAAFSATACDGFAIENGRVTALLAPGSWNVGAHLFPEPGAPGLFGEVRLGGEVLNTGTARLPWVRTTVGI